MIPTTPRTPAQTTLTVTPAALTVAVASATRAYGTANPAFTSTITGAVAGDTFTQTFFTLATITSPVGTYNISDSLTGAAASNYIVTVIPGTLTITTASARAQRCSEQRQLVPTALPTRPSPAPSPARSTVIPSPSPTPPLQPSPARSATYPSRHGLRCGPRKLHPHRHRRNPRGSAGTLTVTANNATRSYGAANPTSTGITAGLLNGDTVTVAYLTTAALNSAVGTYPIVPTVSGAALSNYSLTIVNGTLSITANGNSLVINVHSSARVYGAANPAFAGDVTGVLPGDNVVVTYGTTATTASSSGNYPIGASVSGTSASNYIATINPGALAITAASTITTVATSAPSASSAQTSPSPPTSRRQSVTATGVVTFFDGTVMLGNATSPQTAPPPTQPTPSRLAATTSPRPSRPTPTSPPAAPASPRSSARPSADSPSPPTRPLPSSKAQAPPPSRSLSPPTEPSLVRSL